MDANELTIAAWLESCCEQQSIYVNKAIQESDATVDELRAHYESSYIAMIISLNNVRDKQLGRRNHETSRAIRPDITCLGLVIKARNKPEPHWWNNNRLAAYRREEKEHLDSDWYEAAAELLGLAIHPHGFEDGHWNGIGAHKGSEDTEPDSIALKLQTPS